MPATLPMDLPKMLDAAVLLHRQGLLDAAAEAYEVILGHEPQHQDAVYLRGVVQLQRQDPVRARQLIDHAMALGPARAGMHLNLGHALRALGDAGGAIESYRRALELGPGHDDTRWCLANTLREQGEHAQALAEISAFGPVRQGTALWTLRARVWKEQARRLSECGEHDQAVAALLQRLEYDPADASAHFDLGEQLASMGLPQAAVSAYEAALRRDAEHPEAHNNLACLCLELKQPARALHHAAEAVLRRPGLAAAHNNQALALLDLGRPAEAVQSLEQATRLQPALTQAWANAARAWREIGDFAKSRQACEEALRLDPSFEYLPGQLTAAGMELCDWRDFDSLVDALPQRLAQGERVIYPLQMLSVLDDPALQLQAARIYGQSQFPPNPRLGPLPTVVPGARIRVAYLSADLRRHAVTILMAGVFACHDRAQFEIYGLSTRRDPDDPVQRSLVPHFDRFEDMQGRTAEDVARWCREHRVDILVDLGGYTADNRPDVLACRAAPVQVNFLGYPGTMGMPYVDYIVADRNVIAQDQRQHYSESILYLPEVFQAHDDRRELPALSGVRADWGLPEGAVVFCCFNKSNKITPQVWESWMRILQGVPGSVLWLTQMHDEVAASLARSLARRGIAPSRVRIARRQPYLVYLGLYPHADLFLDTSPFNAGTTARDALWMGLPVLTCCGRSFAARMATSLVRELGLDELVCDGPRAYEETAIALGRDRARLQGLKAQLKVSRKQSIMNDTLRWTRQLETGFAEAVSRSRRGLPPADIFVAAVEDPGASSQATHPHPVVP